MITNFSCLERPIASRRGGRGHYGRFLRRRILLADKTTVGQDEVVISLVGLVGLGPICANRATHCSCLLTLRPERISVPSTFRMVPTDAPFAASISMLLVNCKGEKLVSLALTPLAVHGGRLICAAGSCGHHLQALKHLGRLMKGRPDVRVTYFTCPKSPLLSWNHG